MECNLPNNYNYFANETKQVLTIFFVHSKQQVSRCNMWSAGEKKELDSVFNEYCVIGPKEHNFPSCVIVIQIIKHEPPPYAENGNKNV